MDFRFANIVIVLALIAGLVVLYHRRNQLLPEGKDAAITDQIVGDSNQAFNNPIGETNMGANAPWLYPPPLAAMIPTVSDCGGC